MTPAARIQSVIDLLQKTGASRIPMDGTVGDYMRGRRFIGGKDRAAIVERLYAITRAHARLGWWLAQKGAGDTPRTRTIAWLTLGEGLKADTIANLFDGSRYGAPALSEAEESLARMLENHTIDHPDMPDSNRAECPPQWESRLRARFGVDFEKEMAAMIPPATLDLRVNVRRLSREDAAASLKKDGVKTVPTPYSPWGLRAENKAFLSKTKAFTKGLIEIQDEGSQLIAFLCGAQPGIQVLDYCAGAGGKTLAIAAAMNNKGRIIACDIDAGRLTKGRVRFKRAGVNDIIETRPLSDEKNRKWLRRQKGTFDVTLVDAPCSGTGTWRRNPDLRWRAFGPSLEELLTTQAEIMDKAAKTVKPGGRFVYATCSLLTEENEDQVTAFREKNQDFDIIDVSSLIPSLGSGPFMRLSSARHGTDGFFAAVLQKKA